MTYREESDMNEIIPIAKWLFQQSPSVEAPGKSPHLPRSAGSSTFPSLPQGGTWSASGRGETTACKKRSGNNDDRQECLSYQFEVRGMTDRNVCPTSIRWGIALAPSASAGAPTLDSKRCGGEEDRQECQSYQSRFVLIFGIGGVVEEFDALLGTEVLNFIDDAIKLTPTGACQINESLLRIF